MRKTGFAFGLIILIAVVMLCQSLIFPRPVHAQTSTPQPEQVIIYLFWGDGCPHCEAAKPILKRIAERFPNVEIRDYEVFNSPENREILKKMAAGFGFDATAVPTIFVGELHWQGWSDPTAKEVETAVQACATSGCMQKGAEILSSVCTCARKIIQGKA
ncbi:MAG: thioredoxin family protein [Anaerolineaceae bacterium]|nr:thioredoxin family protein [Anaerolineaceae bacterium]